MVRKVEVAGLVERHKMDVGMWHINTHHSFANLDARADLFQAAGDTACEEMKFGIEVVVEVEYIVDFFLGNTQHMSTDDRVDIKESEAVLGLGHAVAWYLAGHNSTENTSHD